MSSGPFSGGPLPPPPPTRPHWRSLLVGAAFGFGAGLLLITGIVLLISASSASTTTQAPVGNKAANATPTFTATLPSHPTSLPTATPTLTPPPTATSTPLPTPTHTSSEPQSGQVQDNPSFYIVALIVFFLACGIFLARKK